MEKILKLNEDLIDDETNPELLDQMRAIAADLQETLMQYAAIAKAKGIRYNVALAKKGAIDAKMLSNNTKSDEDAVSKANKSNNGDAGEGIEKLSHMDGIIQPTIDSGEDLQSKQSRQKSQRAKILTPVNVDNTDLVAAASTGHENMHLVDDGMPDAFSDDDGEGDDEEDPRYAAVNKHKLLEWITAADFSKEFQLHKISEHKFKLDQDEENAMIGTDGILKICKVMMYKIGLTYKRMDIKFNDLREEFKTDQKLSCNALRKDFSHINEVIQQVHDELENFQQEQKNQQKKCLMEVTGVVKANEQMLTDSKQWHKDIQALAMATSCVAEFISMQTAIDKQTHRVHTRLASDLSERFRITTAEQTQAMTTRLQSVDDADPSQSDEL